MDERVARALGTVWQSDRPWRVLTTLAEFEDRLGGHPGEKRAAEFLSDELVDVGVEDVRQESFAIPEWTRGETSLLVHVHSRDRERTFEARALPYCPEATVEAPLVDVGYGTPEELDDSDVEDAIVVASAATPPSADRFVHRTEKIGHAAERGATGFIFANHRPGQLPPTGSLRVGDTLPAVGVSYETGEWLREYAREGAAARLNVTASVEPGTSQNVRGRFGPETDAAVLLLAHYDAHDVGEGALDNGCGVAVLLSVVGALQDLEIDRGIEIGLVGCEELGLQGSETLAANVDAGDVHAVVNLDGVGRKRTIQALTHGSDQLGTLAAETFDAVGHPLEIQERPHPYSDHWPFLRQGIPALQIHSQTEDETGPWERGWTHTRADTRDKVDRRTLREHAMLVTLLVAVLAGTDLDRIDPDRLRSDLSDAEPSMRAAGVWPDAWSG
ncbi:M28 family metallopeptidase [Halapricum hydrolyticum]|uniref:Carboxypeptidase Q n=1 Tax=Halapricum hydrolyticum TaxID=2979991 RepID=A0AAE3LIZ0_9EURY|nr:M28 family metallopeptidase [Halapricum hydrolyticum]MCU4717673.1 M28 family metallopeptidase [Halapricum hydrolyticum]MCU4726798.1 M28 family metallopeptidase [Halapricum hydrolyticum]